MWERGKAEAGEVKGRQTDAREVRGRSSDCWLLPARVPSLGCCHHPKWQWHRLHCLKQESHFLTTVAASCKKNKEGRMNDVADVYFYIVARFYSNSEDIS